MNGRKVFLVGGLILALLASLIGAVGVSANMGRHSSLVSHQEVAKPEAPPPLLAPPDSVFYSSIPSGDIPNRPIARLRQVPSDINPEAEIHLPEIRPWEDPNQEGYAVLSSLRYSGDGVSVVLTLAEPSPGAFQQLNRLGEEKVELPDQGIAWLSRDMGGDYPNRILFQQNNLIITVAGNLPPDRLIELAQQVEISK